MDVICIECSIPRETAPSINSSKSSPNSYRVDLLNCWRAWGGKSTKLGISPDMHELRITNIKIGALGRLITCVSSGWSHRLNY